jgi:hypothetical protein
MAARAARLCGIDTARGEQEIRDTLSQFGDYRSVSGYAAESLAFCYDSGIMYDSSLDIQPGNSATRADIAQMLYGLLGIADLL